MFADFLWLFEETKKVLWLSLTFFQVFLDFLSPLNFPGFPWLFLTTLFFQIFLAFLDHFIFPGFVWLSLTTLFFQVFPDYFTFPGLPDFLWLLYFSRFPWLSRLVRTLLYVTFVSFHPLWIIQYCISQHKAVVWTPKLAYHHIKVWILYLCWT